MANKNKKILLVEDETIVAQTILHSLVNSGFKTMHVADGRAAVSKVLNDSNLSLILMDIDLGSGIDGIETAEEILKYSDIPILFLSSHTDKELVERTEKVSSYGFIDKNSGMPILVAAINTALKLHRIMFELKEKEKKLTENVDLMQNILDCSTDYIFVKDLELRTILCNEMVAKAVGKKASDLIGHNDIENGVDPELVKGNPEKGLRGYENDDKAALSGETIINPADYVYDNTNGKVYIYDTIKRPLKNSEGKIIGLLGISRDITDRKKSQDEFLESEKRFRMLFNEMTSAFSLHEIILDKKGKPINFTFLEVNSAFEKFTGLLAKDIIGKTIRDVLPDSADHWVDIYGKVAITGKSIKFEDYSVELKRIYSISAFSFKTGYFATIFDDVTNSKNVEKIIASERERLAVTLHSIGDGVITTDTSSKIIMINKAAQDLTGWDAKTAIGMPLSKVLNIFNEISRNPSENPAEVVMRTGNRIELENHTCLLTRDGKELIISDSAAPIRDNENKIIGVVIVFRDMTEKIKLETTIQRNQKLESIGNLAGGIAHDFNNLLAGIFGYIEMAQSFAEKESDVSKYLDKALSAFNRAKALTLQLLTFSKGGAPLKKTINIVPVLKSSTQFSLSGSNLSVEFEIGEDIWMTEVDENQIGQVVDNIVLNAQQAMPNGGNLVVRVQNVIFKPEESPIHSTHKFVKISFQDYGTGIPKEILSRIFDPFFSTKNKGTGLGLSTAFSIVQKHGGFIDVDSVVGKGSTFIIYIPAVTSKSENSQEKDKTSHRGKGKILLMDDEIYILEIESARISSMGYRIFTASNGDEAIQMFKEAEKSDDPFDLLILDLTVPGGKGGVQTISEIRSINTKVPVIIASGYSESPAVAEPSNFGFNASLKKPYTKEELVKVLALFSM